MSEQTKPLPRARLTREWVVQAITRQGHAINANNGRCAVIEDALVQAGVIALELLDRMDAETAPRPRRVVLCGSTRFADAYRDANRTETLAGRIVLSVGLLGHAEGIDMNGPVKAALDELHLRKIDLADGILVVSVGGYVGSSTRNEIDYAIRHGKEVRWMEETAKENYHALAKG